MRERESNLHRLFCGIAFLLLLVTLWSLVQGYRGLTGDAQIYAFQALARIRPQFVADLYLQYTSQDQFTIFSPFYALFIDHLGLETAALLLTLFFITWLSAASWSVVSALAGREIAWLAVASLIILPADYGGAGVFQFSEQFLTARLPAEAIVVTALACHFRGMKRLGLLLALGGLPIHPLIALPACLVLICLWLSPRMCILGASLGVLIALGLSVGAVALPEPPHLLTVMDNEWLDVVKERSQFLFPELWSPHDWDMNARPFLYLAFSWITIQDRRVRKLCMAGILVGSAGLLIALIVGRIGPVAILLQGQAWRWIWVGGLIAVLLLPLTVLTARRDEKCGLICSVLLVAGWTVWDSSLPIALTLMVWSLRTRIGPLNARLLRWAAIAASVSIIAWVLIKSWTIIHTASTHSIWTNLQFAKVNQIFSLRLPAVLLALVVWQMIRDSRTVWTPAVISVVLLAASVLTLPASLNPRRSLPTAAETEEFSEWIRAIPPTATVLVAPPRDVGEFVWFTLGRPNYLSVDQSAGVVFSRKTALEVKRRSQVLLPLMGPNWRFRSRLRARAAGQKADTRNHPLTVESLEHVCDDSELGFVISPQMVGFDPLRHEQDGRWKGWNLYDCRQIRKP